MIFDAEFVEASEEFETKFESTDETFKTEFITIDGAVRGESAYEVAVRNGFEGTEQEWLDSLKGKDGKNGADGYTPRKGIDYFDGAKGDKGDKGDTGAKGADGYTPVKGVDYYTEADRQDIIEDVLARFPSYEGEYTVSPSRQAKTLETANKVLSDDITISEISYSEVSNNSGGTTYYIAKE